MLRSRRAASSDLPSAATIARALEELYRGPAWHGPSVRASLRGVTWARAEWHPAPGRNSIHELVLHLAYTRHRILHRLSAIQGEKTPRFPRRMRLTWFPEAPDPSGDAVWKEDLRLLDTYHEKVLTALDAATPATLALSRRRKGRPIALELLGLAFHDAYHGGQIRLLALMAPDDHGT